MFRFCAEIEAEIASLDRDEQKAFLEEIGLKESGVTGSFRPVTSFSVLFPI